jgi:hypothetical protein
LVGQLKSGRMLETVSKKHNQQEIYFHSVLYDSSFGEGVKSK